MSFQLSTHLVQEFRDLIALSSLELGLKMRLLAQLDVGELDENTFNQVLNLLREEARLDQDIERYSQEVLNFDHDEYLNKVQQIVDTEVKKHLESKRIADSGKRSEVQNSEFRTQNSVQKPVQSSAFNVQS